jgi:hypothetical protein
VADVRIPDPSHWPRSGPPGPSIVALLGGILVFHDPIGHTAPQIVRIDGFQEKYVTMGDVNPDESLEIGPDVFKRLGDCTGAEIESAIRLVARKRIDRAWIDEQAAERDQGALTIGRRFFANTTEEERDLIAYWQMVKLVEEERLRLTKRGDA